MLPQGRQKGENIMQAHNTLVTFCVQLIFNAKASKLARIIITGTKGIYT